MAIPSSNAIVKRIVVKANCVLATPALIGSGAKENTDSDILRNSQDKPFIPGTTIAGVLSELSTAIGEMISDKDRLSPLWVFDAEFTKANEIILDGVALNYENKVAKDEEKYDYEAIDTGAEFTLRLLLNIRESDKGKKYEERLKEIVGALKDGHVALGAKTKRGFGRLECASAVKREFDLTKGNTADLESWIGFDWDDNTGWREAEAVGYSKNVSTVTVNLKLDGSIMIRDIRNIYNNLRENESAPDYKHLTSNDKPVILGTSWAGAFRSTLRRLLTQKHNDWAEKYLKGVFGFVEESGKNDETATAEVSQVVFNASFLERNNEITEGFRSVTRVKIDRFTGGAVVGALFTEKPWYGGTTTLVIHYPKGRDDIKELLLLGIDAIDKGILQVGGESAVGRGFFAVDKEKLMLDDIKIDADQPKHKLIEAIEAMKEKEETVAEDKVGESA